MTVCPICHNAHSDECSRASLLARIESESAMVAKLTGDVASLEDERDALRAQLAEAEATLANERRHE